MTRFNFYPEDRKSFYESYTAEYRFDQTEPTPWSPLRQELKHCKISMITTAGLRLKDHPPYTASRESGSSEVRELPLYMKKNDLVFDYAGFDPRDAQKDINVIAPVDRLIELAEKRVVSEIHEKFHSFYGHATDLETLKNNARDVGRRLRRDQVDGVFVIPVSHVCVQTAGLIAREIEKEGVSTVTLVLIREVAEQVKIPRAVFINFPFGNPLGRPHVLPIQREIVADLCQAMRVMDHPGRITDLPYHWDETQTRMR